MKYIQRNFSGDADRNAMIALAQSPGVEALHITDLPYRLSSWALDEPDNVGLWVDEASQMVAWAVMQTPFWTVDYVCKPEVERVLHPLILAWANQRARDLFGTPYGLPSWYVNCFADQIEQINELERSGYSLQADVGEDSWSKVWMERSGQLDAPAYSPPSGYSLRSLAGESEVEAYVELHRSVFETKNMTTEWRLRTLSSPAYRADLDVVTEAPDNRLAAFCIGWMDQLPGGGCRGQIEPLGYHPDFRKYALGRVVLCEVLRRLQQLGAQCIFVETDTYRNTAFRLYESLGFHVAKDILVFGKDYNAIAG